MTTSHQPLQNHVLIVEDEFLIAAGLRVQLEQMGRTVCATAATADKAIELARQHQPAIILMDMRLRGDKDGVDAALAIHAEIGSKVIFLTGSREPATLARIALDHPAAILFKPVSSRQLRTAMENLSRQPG